MLTQMRQLMVASISKPLGILGLIHAQVARVRLFRWCIFRQLQEDAFQALSTWTTMTIDGNTLSREEACVTYDVQEEEALGMKVSPPKAGPLVIIVEAWHDLNL